MQCWICKKTKFSHPDLTFHSFPVDSHNRAIWLSKLRGKKQEESTPKKATICLTHFRIEDFAIIPSCIRYLKDGALPLFLRWKSSTVTAPDSNFKMIVDAPGPSIKRSRIPNIAIY